MTNVTINGKLRRLHVIECAVLEGYQAVESPSQYGSHCIAFRFPAGDDELKSELDTERDEQLLWAKGKVQGSAVQTRGASWTDQTVRLSWKTTDSVQLQYADGTAGARIRSGDTVKIAFFQKPYVSGPVIGTTLKPVAIRVLSITGNNALSGSSSAEDSENFLKGF